MRLPEAESMVESSGQLVTRVVLPGITINSLHGNPKSGPCASYSIALEWKTFRISSGALIDDEQ